MGLIDWLEAHQELSGWAQTAGALLAIIATWLIAAGEAGRAKRQLAESREQQAAAIEREESRHRELTNSRRAAALAVMRHGKYMIESSRELLKTLTGKHLSETARLYAGDFATLEQQVLSFPAHELDDALATEAFLRAGATASAVKSLMEQFQWRAASGTVADIVFPISTEPLGNYANTLDEIIGFLEARFSLG